MKATICQLKQWTNYQINKDNYVPSEHTTLSLLLVRCVSTPEQSSRTTMGECQDSKKDPSQLFISLDNVSQCIKTGMGYCSNINTFNHYLQKLLWKTRTLELPNFSRWKAFSVTTRKTKNKTLQQSWKNAATPNYKMKQRTSSPHNAALEGRITASSIYRRLKFLIKVLCTLSHNSGTGITQPATVILHMQ